MVECGVANSWQTCLVLSETVWGNMASMGGVCRSYVVTKLVICFWPEIVLHGTNGAKWVKRGVVKSGTKAFWMVLVTLALE